jgi:hypothetical protein
MVRDQEAGGSNPLAPTIYPSRYQKRAADLLDLRLGIVGATPAAIPVDAQRNVLLAGTTNSAT